MVHYVFNSLFVCLAARDVFFAAKVRLRDWHQLISTSTLIGVTWETVGDESSLEPSSCFIPRTSYSKCNLRIQIALEIVKDSYQFAYFKVFGWSKRVSMFSLYTVNRSWVSVLRMLLTVRLLLLPFVIHEYCTWSLSFVTYFSQL